MSPRRRARTSTHFTLAGRQWHPTQGTKKIAALRGEGRRSSEHDSSSRRLPRRRRQEQIGELLQDRLDEVPDVGAEPRRLPSRSRPGDGSRRAARPQLSRPPFGRPREVGGSSSASASILAPSASSCGRAASADAASLIDAITFSAEAYKSRSSVVAAVASSEGVTGFMVVTSRSVEAAVRFAFVSATLRPRRA